MPERGEFVFLGVGGAGCRILDACCRAHPHDPPNSLALHTDAEALASLIVPRRMVLGGEAAEGLSSGGDPEAGRSAAEASADVLQEACARIRLAIIVAGLGGGTGSGAAPTIARLARDSGALVLAVVTLPFFFEGQQRRRRAEEALQGLRRHADAVVVFPNQRMIDTVDASRPVGEAFARVDKAIGEALILLLRVLGGAGLIRLDFSDFRAMVRASGGTLAMSWAEAQGEDRCTQAVDRLIRSSLLEHGNVLAMARALLVCVAGGDDLRLTEVEAVMKRLGELTRPDVGLHFGIVVEPGLANRLSLTVLAAETDSAAPSPREDPDVESETARPAAAPGTEPPAPSDRGQRKPSARVRAVQGSLPLDGAGKGRFRNVEPTVYEGEDLDVPTFLRRGLPPPRI